MSKQSLPPNKRPRTELIKAQQREYYQRNKEVIKERSRQDRIVNWRKHDEYQAKRRANFTAEDKEKLAEIGRKSALYRKYGITPEGYNKLLAEQKGCCALCSKHLDELNERYGVLNVDHDHASGKIRGLLCTPCNHALGVLGDNADGLLKAFIYVKTRG